VRLLLLLSELLLDGSEILVHVLEFLNHLHYLVALVREAGFELGNLGVSVRGFRQLNVIVQVGLLLNILGL